MTVENTVVEAVEAPKRRSRKPKVEKKAIQIMEEVAALQKEVHELEVALDEIDPSSIFRPVAQELYSSKVDELDKALNTIYTV